MLNQKMRTSELQIVLVRCLPNVYVHRKQVTVHVKYLQTSDFSELTKNSSYYSENIYQSAIHPELQEQEPQGDLFGQSLMKAMKVCPLIPEVCESGCICF